MEGANEGLVWIINKFHTELVVYAGLQQRRKLFSDQLNRQGALQEYICNHYPGIVSCL